MLARVPINKRESHLFIKVYQITLL